MNWDMLDAIDWESHTTTEDWVKTLNGLQSLIATADTSEKRTALADKLDEFAENSTGGDLATLVKLDRAAWKAALALRNDDTDARIRELEAASGDFKAAVKDFSAATAVLKKEASLLRAEKFTAAVTSLTDMISAVKNLTQVAEDDEDEALVKAVEQVVKSAQKLRGILEENG
jgi:5'-deoxynucleotidase YfbR-like HD superfamily hydrolase